jgi:hypothetical protein
LLLVASALVISPLAGAADEPPSDNKPQEVVIEATRANLNKIGNEVKLAEFKFYKRYNDFNKKREYAINCNKQAALGTRFTADICQPLYATRAEEAEAAQFMQMIGAGELGFATGPTNQRQLLYPEPARGSGMGGGAPAKLAIEAGKNDFQKNVIEVTNSHPELQKLLGEHARLWKQWEDLYYRVNGREVRKAGETSDSKDEYNYDRDKK